MQCTKPNFQFYVSTWLSEQVIVVDGDSKSMVELSNIVTHFNQFFSTATTKRNLGIHMQECDITKENQIMEDFVCHRARNVISSTQAMALNQSGPTELNNPFEIYVGLVSR